MFMVNVLGSDKRRKVCRAATQSILAIESGPIPEVRDLEEKELRFLILWLGQKS
jgi:hypothetical protein